MRVKLWRVVICLIMTWFLLIDFHFLRAWLVPKGDFRWRQIIVNSCMIDGAYRETPPKTNKQTDKQSYRKAINQSEQTWFNLNVMHVDPTSSEVLAPVGIRDCSVTLCILTGRPIQKNKIKNKKWNHCIPNPFTILFVIKDVEEQRWMEFLAFSDTSGARWNP